MLHDRLNGDWSLPSFLSPCVGIYYFLSHFQTASGVLHLQHQYNSYQSPKVNCQLVWAAGRTITNGDVCHSIRQLHYYFIGYSCFVSLWTLWLELKVLKLSDCRPFAPRVIWNFFLVYVRFILTLLWLWLKKSASLYFCSISLSTL